LGQERTMHNLIPEKDLSVLSELHWKFLDDGGAKEPRGPSDK